MFFHDLLDHLLFGFGVSGHGIEAMALIQFSEHTNSDPALDYEQMVKEDIMSGRVNGETSTTFLPDRLMKRLPVNAEMPS